MIRYGPRFRHARLAPPRRLSSRVLLLLAQVLAFAVPNAPVDGFALEAIRQVPSFESKLVLTATPLTVVFDQSLDTSTIGPDSFQVMELESAGPVPGGIEIQSTHIPNDTVVFTPDMVWQWAVRYRLVVTGDVKSLSGDPFSGVLPHNGVFVANIPNDLLIPEWDPSNPFGMFADTTPLMGFNPMNPEADAEPWEIPGSNVTGAWKYTKGRPDVIIAMIDDGIRDYSEPEIRRAFFLNAGELPLPNEDGEPCAEYDCNGDGRFDVDDYARDNRLDTSDPISALNLIRVFSNGVDEDGNGLPDDISGWDFFRGVNTVLGIAEVPDIGAHGQGQAEVAMSQGDNGEGIRPGVCSECRLLPIRAGANIIYEYGYLAAAARYAVSMGASVLSLAGANFTWSLEGHQAFLDAMDAGAVTVAASGDEMTFHHWMPAHGEGVLNVKTIFSFPPVDLFGNVGLDSIAFTETFCTNYGPHVHLAVPAASFCTSEGTATVTGMLGLLFSYARDRGILLEPDELKQLLAMTAYDIHDRCASVVNLCNVCQAGVEEHFGYGRPDLERCMQALGDPALGIEPSVPPTVRIREPVWWQTIDPAQTPFLDVTAAIHSRVVPYTWRLQVAEGHEPLEEAFQTVETGTEDGPVDGVIGSVPVAEIFTEDWAVGVPLDRHTFEVTLRVQAAFESEGRGTVTGEARKTVSVHTDNDPQTGLVPGFPMWIGASGESSPVLYDLDGDPDRRLEIVFGTGAGRVVALKYDETEGIWKDMPGFPLDLSGDDPWVEEAVFASVAVGDLLGDGTPEIVAATTGGKVYAMDPERAALDAAPFLPGFPVHADPSDNSSAKAFFHGNGFMASPVLADLDKDGMLEIIAASMDQKVYAWKVVGETGHAERLSGWPVLCRSLAGLVPEERVCQGAELPSPILGTPAVGILDPDSPDPYISDYPSVVVASNESCPGGLLPQTRVYAVFHDGMDHDEGPFLPGWPATPAAPFSGFLELIPFITGSAASPAVARTDQGTYVALGTTGWFPQLLRYASGSVSSQSIPLLIHVNAIGSPIFTSLLNDGELQFVVPMTGAVRVDDSGFELFNSSVLALSLSEPHDVVLEGLVEDIPMLAAPSVADLDNNGTPEVLVGSGGYLAHAFSADGTEALGWPKYTHKWIMATPAAGDIDGDGKMEVVVPTREGSLYAWESEGAVCPQSMPNSDWPRFHHDEHNTGFYGTDTTPPMRILDLTAARSGEGRLNLRFTATGDDWTCGTAALYDVRFATDSDADLTDPDEFDAATRIDPVPVPVEAGTIQSFAVSAPGARGVAVRVMDDAGNLSRISNHALVPPSQEESAGSEGGCGCAMFHEESGRRPLQPLVAGFFYLLPVGFVMWRLYKARQRPFTWVGNASGSGTRGWLRQV